MRIFRIVAIAAAALIALLIVGGAALLLFVDPNRYRPDIERAAVEHTGRQLTIQGKLELKLFPWLALAVHDVQLGNPPGYGAQPFMTVQNVSIGVKLLPLLAKRLEVRRVEVDGLSINLVSRGEANNWKDLGESHDATGAKPAGAQPPENAARGYASIEGVDVSKAQLTLRDELKKTTMELANLEVHSGLLASGDGRTSLQNLVLQGTWATHTSEAPDKGAGEATTSKAADEAAGRVSEPAKPLAFSLRTAAVTLDDNAHSLAPAKIEVQVGDSTVVVSVAGEKLSTDRVVTGELTIPKTSARQLLQSLGITPPLTRDSKSLAAFALQTNFRLTQKQLQLSGLQLTLDDTRVQGAAGIEDLDSMALSFDLNVNGINLDRYRPPLDKAEAAAARKAPAGPVPPKAATPLPLEAMRKLDAHGMLRVGTATFANLVFTDVTMPLLAKDGHIHLGPTKARLYGGEYNGDIILDARPVQAQLSLNEHVRGTDIGALVKAAFDSARIAGHADANVAVTGVGNTDAALTRSLTGKIDATVQQGALLGVDITYELQRATALLNRQAPPQRTGPVRTAFNSLQTSDTLDKGVLRTDELKIETDFLKVHGGGTLDLDSEAIDYKLIAAFYKSPPSQGGAGSGLVSLKSLEVPLDITGTMANPTVRPDIEALAKGQLGQEVKQRAGDLVKKKLGDKLKDLFGH